MKEDNFFIFSTIFVDNWVAKILGNNWPWIIPMHLSYFNQKNINYFLHKHNFEIVSISNHVHHAKINYAIKGHSGVVGLDEDKENQLQCIDFKRIKLDLSVGSKTLQRLSR